MRARPRTPARRAPPPRSAAALAALAAALLIAPRAARADDVLRLGAVTLDRPTLHALGVQVIITDDDDRDGAITVRWRPAGTSTWIDGYPLFRVHPEEVTSFAVPPQFAGSIFDLTPGTDYEIELHAVDADGPVDVTMMLTGSTRPLPPADPAAPRSVAVADAAALNAALAAAQAGDVITLMNGTYTGSFFTLLASGTAADPIVLRGESEDGVIVDGAGCAGCNIFEIYGSFVHLERMTIQNGERAIRFLNSGTEGNVVRRVHIRDVVHGIGSAPDQLDFYICDNVIEGRLVWPLTYADDGGLHADDQGVRVDGDGHVVCYNDISGFGDPMINFKEGGRSYDFYGNDIHEIYGDGTELDRGAGNVRCFGNRWTNVYTAISIQPANGGPTYVLRNVIVNVADEQIKLKSVGGTFEPSGVLVFHNTFVSPDLALNLQTPVTGHNYLLENNLFIGPSPTAYGRTVDWTEGVDEGVWDYDGYYPDEEFWFGVVGGVDRLYPDLAAAMAAGVEPSGVGLVPPFFASGFLAPTDYTIVQPPQDLTLASGSNAVDRGLLLPGIDDGYVGAAPDLGAIETGCLLPLYGPRPEGMEAYAAPVNCVAGGPGGGDAGTPASDGGGGGDGGIGADGGGDGGAGNDAGAGGGRGGCHCSVAGAPAGARARAGAGLLAPLALAALLARHRSRRCAPRSSSR